MNIDTYILDMKLISGEFDILTMCSNLKPSYDVLSDSLVWSDEFPEKFSHPYDKYSSIRAIHRYRTCIELDIRDDKLEIYKEFWDQGIQLFPNWPGFNIDRVNSLKKYSEIYTTGVSKS